MEWKYTNRINWHKWFAWYPVRLGDWFSSEEMAWLEIVERKRGQYDYSYRKIIK